MLSIEGSLERRRRRGQDGINVLVREFYESGLSQKEFALKVGVHPLTVARWVECNRPAVLSITHKFQPSKIQKILKKNNPKILPNGGSLLLWGG